MADPYDLIPEPLRLTEPHDLAEEARRLAGQYRNGYMRGQTLAYKRQWLQRVAYALDALARTAEKEPMDYRGVLDACEVRRKRDKQLAEARGEPDPENEPIGRPHSPTHIGG